MVELPKNNPTLSQLKEKLQHKLALQPSFVISRHHGGKAISSQTDLEQYLSILTIKIAIIIGFFFFF